MITHNSSIIIVSMTESMYRHVALLKRHQNKNYEPPFRFQSSELSRKTAIYKHIPIEID